MNSSLIQKLLFLHKKSSKPQEAKNEKIEISLENGKFDNFVDNGLEAGDGGGEAWRRNGASAARPPGGYCAQPRFLLLHKKIFNFLNSIFLKFEKIFKDETFTAFQNENVNCTVCQIIPMSDLNFLLNRVQTLHF